MKLKHMVKDKINYRAQGPRTVLIRQTVKVERIMAVFVWEKWKVMALSCGTMMKTGSPIFFS
jgi:hypothetical protein